ncbi:MAG: hypothetical protein ABEJ67_06315 [Halanaeroarchaeum sp.]
MDRAVPALLAALLVVASAGSVVGVSPPDSDATAARTPVESISANTSDVLVLDTIGASTFDRADLVVTAALDAQTGALENAFARYRVAAAVEAADSPAAKRTVLQNASRWARERTAALLSAERTARQRYLAGDTTAAEYLTELGRLHRRASAVETTVNAIDDLEEENGFDAQVDRLLPDLHTLQGPIRAALADAVAGEGVSGRTFVAVSGNGVVLAQIRDGTYVRETMRLDNRDDAIGQMTFDQAETRFNELYPWASSVKQRISMGALGPDTFVVEFTHTHGTIDATLDASTRQIFREIQTKRLAETPADPMLLTTDNETRVVVSRAYAGGPLKINVTDTNGTALDAAVSVNGTTVGRTGEDGIRWTISPAGTYDVVVDGPYGQVSMQVTATDPSDRTPTTTLG